LGIAIVIGGQLGIDTVLTVLAYFWRDPFLKVLTFYGVGSLVVCVLMYRFVLIVWKSEEAQSIGCWLGLWGLMGLPCLITALLIANLR
jgi:hypothetical protein